MHIQHHLSRLLFRVSEDSLKDHRYVGHQIYRVVVDDHVPRSLQICVRICLCVQFGEIQNLRVTAAGTFGPAGRHLSWPCRIRTSGTATPEILPPKALLHRWHDHSLVITPADTSQGSSTNDQFLGSCKKEIQRLANGADLVSGKIQKHTDGGGFARGVFSCRTEPGAPPLREKAGMQ